MIDEVLDSLPESYNDELWPKTCNKIRVAGTAEFNDYDTSLHEGRLQNLFNLLGSIFPESTPYVNEATTTKWTGLRPVSASGVPIISQTKVKNLYLNTGHGHLG